MGEDRFVLHELKNILTVLNGTIKMIELKSPPFGFNEYVHKKLQTISTLINRAVFLINNKQLYEDKFEHINSGGFFERCRQIYIDAIASMNGHVKVEYSLENEDFVIYTNKECIETIFLNLIKNAIEELQEIEDNENREKKIKVSLYRKENTIIRCIMCGEKHGNFYEFSVEDNGRGITEESSSKIFNFGYSTKKEGSGIGLYNVLVLSHIVKGHVSLNSNVDSCYKTKFSVYIPFI